MTRLKKILDHPWFPTFLLAWGVSWSIGVLVFGGSLGWLVVLPPLYAGFRLELRYQTWQHSGG